MAEDENKKINIDADDLKNQAKDTAKQVKDTIKDVDFKNDTKEATGLVKEMFSNPFEAVRRVANEEDNAFKKSIVIMIIFIAASVLTKVLSLAKWGSFSRVGTNIMGLLASFLHPIFYIVVPAIIILVMNRNNKKSLPVVISTLVTAAVPTIIAEVIDVLEGLVGAISLISSPISSGLYAITTVLTYYGIKELFAEKDNAKSIKVFAIVEVISALIFYLLVSAKLY